MWNEKGYDESLWFEHDVFAVSIQAVKTDSGNTVAEHTIVTLQGGYETEEEVTERALDMARERWPEEEGWGEHSARSLKITMLAPN